MPDTYATLEAVSDEALARRIADGPRGSTDAEEAELYRRFAPRVRLYGRRHLPNAAGADDLAQDVLLLTIERLHAGSRGGVKHLPPASWRQRWKPRRRPWPHSTRRASRHAYARSPSATGLS